MKKEDESRVDSFDKLIVWQEARKLTKQIYELTRRFPKEEQFGLTNQMRRAANSVGANIAEGFSRRTMADKIYFYSMAQGSLTELQNYLYTALDVDYITDAQRIPAYNQAVKTHKVLTGLIKSTKRRTE